MQASRMCKSLFELQNMARRRGGQPKHWAEQARIRAWYEEIHRRCDLTDHRLDIEFAYTEKGLKDIDSVARPRTFEGICKFGRKPTRRDERWRCMSELVDAVEQDSRFSGTKSLYEAALWDLLQETTVKPAVLLERIKRLLETHQLLRCDPWRNPCVAKLVDTHGIGPIFDRCLRLSLSGIDRFSRIALVWSLHQGTEPAQSYHLREVVERIADELLDNFFADFLPDQHLVLYTDAVNALLQTRINLDVDRMVGYGYLEILGTWPILPRELSSSISEEHLFHGAGKGDPLVK